VAKENVNVTSELNAVKLEEDSAEKDMSVPEEENAGEKVLEEDVEDTPDVLKELE